MENREMSEQPGFDSWAVVELMGHVKMAGRVTEEERFGAKMGRVDIPQGDAFVTQYFGGGSVYRLTPCTEETARRVATLGVPKPVNVWELPAPQQESRPLETSQRDWDDGHGPGEESECDDRDEEHA